MAELSAGVSLRLRAGEDFIIEIVVSRDGEEVDISGMTARFVVRRKLSSEALITTEGDEANAEVDITDGPNGVFTISVDDDETLDFKGTYLFEAELEDFNGDVSCVARGYLTFVPKLI